MNSKSSLCWEIDETVYHIVKRLQQTGIEGLFDQIRVGKKGNPLGIVQEIEIWPYY